MLTVILGIALAFAFALVMWHRAARRGNADSRAMVERTERTRALLFPKPIPGREQFLRDLRSDGSTRDGLWRARRRRDHETRNRRKS